MKIFNIIVPFTDTIRDVHRSRLENVKQVVRDKQTELQDLRMKEANAELLRKREHVWLQNEELKRKLEFVNASEGQGTVWRSRQNKL